VNVFEGIMAYKLPDSDAHAVICLDEHLDRLARSASLLNLPRPYSAEELKQGVAELIRAEPSPDDLYIRPTLYLDSGAYTASLASLRMGAYITSYTRQRAPLKKVNLVRTPRTRVPDSAFPTQAKSGAIYSAFRLARIAAAQAGGEEPILLNERGTVAETAGAAVLAVFGNRVLSPPVEDGALDSITRAMLARLGGELGLEFSQASLNPAQLLEADEVLLCGTLDEVVTVASIDGVNIEPKHATSVASRLFDRYRQACLSDAEFAQPFQTRVSWTGR
jgi:branched-chain amino acid aminotransferase